MFFDPNSFIEQGSDTTNLITWLSLTNGESSITPSSPFAQIVDPPGYARNRFSGLILSNDEIVIGKFGNPSIRKISPSQNQFNIDLSNLIMNNSMSNLNWQSMTHISSSCSSSGEIPNTNFCEGINGEIFYAYCNNGMSSIAKITNDTIVSIIADSISGNSVRNLAFYGNTLYLANSTGVFK